MKYFVLITVLLSLFSCKKKEALNADIANIELISFTSNLKDKINFSSFVDTIEIIQLETNDKNLIGEVNRIIYINDKYYIRSTQGMQQGILHIFDKKGKHLWTLQKRGEGPGEYPDLKDFSIADNGNIIVSTFLKIINYDSTGVFVSESKTNTRFKELLSIGNDDFVAYIHNAKYNNNNNLLRILDSDGNTKSDIFQASLQETMKSDFLMNWRNMVSFDNDIYFCHSYCDTIFQISRESIKGRYYVNYGDKRIPENLLNVNDDLASWENKLSKLDDYIHTSAIGVTDNYVYVGSINKSYQAYITLYDKSNKRTLSAHKLVDDMYLKGNMITVTAKCIPHNIDGNDILWELEPKYLIDGYKKYMSNLSEPRRKEFNEKYGELARICTELKIDDNPVILRMKIKKELVK